MQFDWRLAPYDILQSQAHARGLQRIGVLSEAELELIVSGLERVRERMTAPASQFEEADEDIHMAVERLLGEEIGALAGKLHTGRSRNDQVATDIAMVVQAALAARDRAAARAAMERPARRSPRPTRTGRCPATPTCSAPSRSTSATTCSPTSGCSRATSCASFAADSASVMPLGSGALAGVNWPIDREIVAAELGFEQVSHELARRRLQPRLRHRLSERRRDLRRCTSRGSARSW